MKQSAWGYASDSMYRRRWALIEPQISRDRFTLIDWGSDSGWFSVTTALAFPGSSVIAVDGSVMLGDSNIQEHLAKIAEEKIGNDTLVNCLFDADTFSALKSCPVHYQYALSVFHWMGDGIGRPLRNKDDWDQAFLDLIGCAEVTFFEVPNEDDPQETPHRIRTWYDSRAVAQAMTDAIQKSGVNAKIRLLGDIDHNDKGLRKLFMIKSEISAIDAGRSDEVAEVIKEAGSKISLPLSLVARSKLRKLRQFLSANTSSA